MFETNKNRISEDELLKRGYRKYSGEELDVFYNQYVCEHVGNCVFGNSDIYDVDRKPWILPDNASTVENKRVANLCPMGALKYSLKNGEE